MGNSEETKLSKPEKPPSPPPDQANVHVYPDWAAMQAYYGPRVAAPPYFNSAVVSGHAPPPYMWGPPQHTMPPYGVPYAAIYAHGGVYAHPGVPYAASPNIETPVKSSGNSDQGLTKKLKGFDGLAMSLSNGKSESAEGGANHANSQSEETESSSDESKSNGNTERAGQNGRRRSREEKPTNGRNRKTETNGAPDMGVNVVGPVMALELSNPPNAKNERELKRERRKQSNRESARRSRLRKQAEAEELAVKVESLTAENSTLKTEINRLTDNSGKLKLENAILMEKLKNARGQAEVVNLTNVDDMRVPVCTENLLCRVDNSGSADRGSEGGEMYDKKSGVKLRQLMDKSPQADAVVAR